MALICGYDDNLTGSVIFDGGGQGPVITINNGQDQSSILLGFQIQNGNSQNDGGGILIENSSPTIDRNIITNNSAGNGGGVGGVLVILGSSYPHIFGNQIYNNYVSGIVIVFAISVEESMLTLFHYLLLEGPFLLAICSMTITQILCNNLYRHMLNDSMNWIPIYAHHNFFSRMPSGFT